MCCHFFVKTTGFFYEFFSSILTNFTKINIGMVLNTSAEL